MANGALPMLYNFIRFTALPAATVTLCTLAWLPASAESYVFDQKRTEVRFAYLMGPAKQHGRFSRVDGTLQFDEAAPERSQVTATVETASLETGQPLVDDELKGSDFFNVKAEPALTFTSRTVRSMGDGAAEMKGDITVNGITKPVTLEVTLRAHDDPALEYSVGTKEFVATTRIQRSAFKMNSFESMVSDEIDIEIDAIVRRQR
jgi:polyisoprenoid-binding protein YceI